MIANKEIYKKVVFTMFNKMFRSFKMLQKK